jgi:autotransporter-associated beta strand protein
MLFAAIPAEGQTWNGGGGDNKWSTGSNWTVAPLNNGTAAVAFAGTTRLAPDMDANWSILSLTFNSGAGAFTLGSTGGFTLTIGLNGITNNSTNTETINNAITLGAAQTWSAASGNLTFGGNVANAGFLLTIGGSSNTSASGVISGTGGLTKSGTGTLTLSGANTYGGATTLSAGTLNINNSGTSSTNSAIGTGALTISGGTIDNTTAGSITLATNNAVTLGGSFTFGGTQNLNMGTGAITNAGNRTITLNGSNSTLTFGGTMTNTSNAIQTTTVNGAGNTLSLGGYALSSNATSRVDVISGTGNVTITGAVTNGGTATASGLTYSGTGVLTLTGTNTYGGATTISTGVLNIQNASALGTTAAGTTVSAGAALQIQGSITVGAEALTLNGDGIASDGALRNISGNNSMSGGITLGSATTIGSDAGVLTLSGVITDGGNKFGLTKAGAGELILSGNNSYEGFTLNAGRVGIGNANALGGNKNIIINGGDLYNSSGASLTEGQSVQIFSDFTVSGSQDLIFSGNTALKANVAINVTNTGQTNFSGILSGLFALTKNGTGVLVLSGTSANTYTGATTVNDGELDLNKTSGLNAFAGTLTIGDGTGAADSAITKLLASNQIPGVAVTINSDGLLNLNNFSDTIGALTMTSGDVTTGTGTLTLSGDVTGNAASNAATISGNLALGANRIFAIADGSAAVDMNVSAVVSGAFTLTKSGTGTMVLSGVNTYTGATTVSAGVLDIQNATALGTTAAGTTVSSGATLAIEGGITVGAEALTISGTGASGQNGALVNVNGTNNYGGLLTLGAASTISSDSGTLNLTNTGTITGATFGLTLTGSGNGTVSSIIGTTSGALTKAGSGTWTLSGANTYTGGTNINGGILALGSSGAIGSSGTISFGGGTLQYSASNTTDYSNRFSTAANQAYSIDTNSQNVTFATALTSSGGSLTKLGSGTLTLSAANTYTAGTTVSAGTLQLSGSGTLGSTSGSLTVNGGTVDLNGTNQTVGALSGSGGTILNNSTGTAKTLTVGQGGGTGSYAGVIADHTSGTGTVALTKTGTGTETLTGANTFTGATTINGGTLTLSAASGSALGSTTSITVNSSGTVMLGASDQINNSATMTLAGGTFSRGGAYSEGTTSAVGIGALTLTADSHIDFTSAAVGTLTLASLTTNAHIITIDNWSGTYNHVGSASTDRLVFDSDQTANLAKFYFTGYGAGGVEFSLGGGFFEVVAAVPEPSTWLGAALALSSIVLHRWRRSKRG